jgi:type IV pilus assembly protein PilN
MRTRINLLPWREEQRKQRNIEFGIMAGTGAFIAFAIAYSLNLVVNDWVAHQKARNNFLEKEIKVLESKLETIKELEAVKEGLLARMNIIQELQGSRPQIVHTFEQLVLTLPDGIWLDSVAQSSGKLQLSGQASSNARVSAYMRNLDESEWFKDPVLVSIINKSDDSATFTLSISEESPVPEDEEDN